MRLVVTNGTATALKSVAGGPVFGKTGTAEYGTSNPPATHAWFVGWQGNVAFAVLVEEGKSGATVAAPIAKAFLANLQLNRREAHDGPTVTPKSDNQPRDSAHRIRQSPPAEAGGLCATTGQSQLTA